MNKFILTCVGVALSISTATAQGMSDKGPTMGWSSWNTYGFNISEDIIKKQAMAMRSKGFLAAGYTYVNIDDGYFGGRDENGHLLIHPTRFPNGMKVVVDYIHRLGMKAGIYSDAGKNTCASYFGGDKIGEGVGLLGHEQDDANFWFIDLGFDFIKVDFCGGSAGHNKDHLQLNEEQRYRAIWKAIQNTGRTDVRMNICRWAFPGTWATDVSTSWRTTGDINCSWGSIKSILKENFYLSGFCGPNSFNDMDMLEVGRGLSTEEDKTHFGMWCIMDSPLLIGCEVSSTSDEARKLMCNKELIALNQDTLFQQAYVVKREGERYVLVKDLEIEHGNVRAVALVNLSDVAADMEIALSDLDLGGTVNVRDLFLRRDQAAVTDTLKVRVPSHGTRIYRLEAEKRYERTLYEAETAFLTAYQELVNNQTLPSAVFQEDDASSGGAKVGWLGNSQTNDLRWRNVYSFNGGNYTMTLDYVTGESRTITVQVNGKTVKRIAARTAGWNNIQSVSLDIELQPGRNEIRLFNSAAWMPDVDCMHLKYNGSTGIDDVKMGKNGKGVYSIDGVKQQAADGLSRGIYVIDGKKVAISK